MKRLFFGFWFLILALAVVLTLPTRAEEQNLIANPSAESLNSDGTPVGWKNGSWGERVANVSTKSPGYTGSRSLLIDVSSAQSGDAKWMHETVPVSAGKKYVYTSWYKASTATEIDVQFLNSGGAASYAYVASVSPSDQWTQLSVEFIVPATATKASVMHIVAGPGRLEIDDVSLVRAVEPLPPTDDNLLVNPSVETVNGAKPAGWNNNAWGQNTAAFSYGSGRTGNKGVTVSVSSFTSGDAKWYAEPVAISGGTVYRYSDYYMSNVPTRVVAAYIDANGAYSYAELPTAPASTVWSQYSADFTAPSTAKKVSIYHVIDRPGTLTIDDVVLQPVKVSAPGPQPVPSTGLLPNPSLETANGTVPAGWTSDTWGANNAAFQYVNEGRTGSRSVKVTVSNYQDGDAKWYFNPITNVKPGQTYQFSVWYKTNVTPRVVVMYNMTDGTTRYAGMPITRPAANAATTWQHYKDTFKVPAGTVSVSAFLFVTQNGWLQTDDYSLDEHTVVGFSQPLLTLTFDDGHEDNKTTALPLLNKYGLKTTQCYATDFIEGQPREVTDGVLAFARSGHETCSHTVSHPALTSTSASRLTYELQHAQAYLRQLTGHNVDNVASPYGDYDARVIEQMKKYYRSHRSVDEGFNSKDNFDIYNIRVQNILNTTTAAQVSTWIKEAQADKTWLVLVYHRVGSNPGPYDTTLQLFTQHIEAIRASGITVKTYNDALNNVTAQL